MSSNSSKFNLVKQKYKLLKEQSKIGEAVIEDDDEDKVTLSLKGYKVRLASLAAAVAIFTGLAVAGAPTIAENLSNQEMITDMSIEFYRNVLIPETHRTSNGQYYYYDYDDILAKMIDSEDFDVAVYLLYRRVGYYQTGKTLELTPYESFTNYLKVKGFRDVEDFESHIRQKIITKTKLDKLSDEQDNTYIKLLQLQNKHVSDLDALATMK